MNHCTFFHIFKYRIIQLFHTKSILIWVFLFPVILATLFYLGFGNMIIDNDNTFEAIPIAVVTKDGGNQILKQVLDTLSEPSDDQMLQIQQTKEKKAKKLLKSGKVDGILYEAPEPSLTVLEEGLSQSILCSFLSQFIQQSDIIEEIIQKNPEKAHQVVLQLSKDTSFNKTISMTDSKNTNCLTQYFYALIAMVCLYGCYLGMDTIMTLQPHLSEKGARKSIVPVHRFKMILADYLASVLANYLSVIILILYIIFILKIDLGSKILLALPAAFAGSLCGVAIGTFFGSLGTFSKETKEGLAISYSMLCCFLGGLMVNTMPAIIQQHAPLVNRINPAYLLSDSFYVLDIYQDHTRFFQNILSLLVITALFFLGSYIFLPHKQRRS